MKKTPRKTTKVLSGRSASPSANGPKSASLDSLSLAEIRELIELISEKQFNEFELERGGFRLRLQKGAGRSMVETSAGAAALSPLSGESRPASIPSSMEQVFSAKNESAPVATAPAERDLAIIPSPIVGTFYRASSPTAEPFVKIGDAVEVGNTVCIIEAMKLMNEIQAEAAGTIAKIFVENGQPVEYGQPLFGLKV